MLTEGSGVQVIIVLVTIIIMIQGFTLTEESVKKVLLLLKTLCLRGLLVLLFLDVVIGAVLITFLRLIVTLLASVPIDIIHIIVHQVIWVTEEFLIRVHSPTSNVTIAMLQFILVLIVIIVLPCRLALCLLFGEVFLMTVEPVEEISHEDIIFIGIMDGLLPLPWILTQGFAFDLVNFLELIFIVFTPFRY